MMNLSVHGSVGAILGTNLAPSCLLTGSWPLGFKLETIRNDDCVVPHTDKRSGSKQKYRPHRSAKVSSNFIGERVVIVRAAISMGRTDFHVVGAIRRPHHLFGVGVEEALRHSINVDGIEHARHHVFICTPKFLRVLNAPLNIDTDQWHSVLLGAWSMYASQIAKRSREVNHRCYKQGHKTTPYRTFGEPID